MTERQINERLPDDLLNAIEQAAEHGIDTMNYVPLAPSVVLALVAATRKWREGKGRAA